MIQDVFCLHYGLFARVSNLTHECIENKAGCFAIIVTTSAQTDVNHNCGEVITSIHFFNDPDLTSEINLPPEYHKLPTLDPSLQTFYDHMSMVPPFVVRFDSRERVSAMPLITTNKCRFF